MDINILGIGIYCDKTKSIDFTVLLENEVSIPDFSSKITDETNN